MMHRPIRVLLVDDELALLRAMSPPLLRRGYLVQTATDGAEALAMLERDPCDVVVLDRRMAGMDGDAALIRIKRQHPRIEVIILTGHGSIPSAVDCTRVGSFCYLEKPVPMEVLTAAIEEAVHHQWSLAVSHQASMELRFAGQFVSDQD